MKKILLCCNAGMSTSLLVQKMQKIVTDRGLDVEVGARPMHEAVDHLDDANIVLLGPQIGFAKSEFDAVCSGKGIAVDVIDMEDYGRMNAEKILDDALAKIG